MKKIIFLICTFSIFSFSYLSAEAKKTVCLNMIVKNESKVIERCLRSLKNNIDYWVIVDTGSTDGTQEIIKNFMKGIPGELHQSDWVNFEYNRNEALQLARGKGDFLLFIDADEQFAFSEDFSWGKLDKDSYYIVSKFNDTRYNRMQLVNNHLNWKWVGVLHEYLDCAESKSSAVLPNISNIVTPDGCRSQDPKKFIKDALLLEKALEKDPTNCRYMFYLGQSYRDAYEYEKSISAYRKRIKMGGFPDEIFWSWYQIGTLQEKLHKKPEEFLKSYAQAYLCCPNRAEPLNKMITYYRMVKDYKKGYEMARLALTIPYPDSSALFIESWVYSYNILLECSIDAYWIGKYKEAKELSEQLLDKGGLPPNVVECVKNNLKWANSMIYNDNINELKSIVKSLNCGHEVVSK